MSLKGRCSFFGFLLLTNLLKDFVLWPVLLQDTPAKTCQPLATAAAACPAKTPDP